MTTIHRYWHNEDLPGLYQWTGACANEVHPTDRVKTWTPATLPEDIVELLTGVDHRHDSNLVRYALLQQFGGLWLDCDVIPLYSLTQAARPWIAYGGGYEGSAMFFPQKNHPMFEPLLHRSQRGEGTSPVRSGAQMLGEYAHKHRIMQETRVLPFDAKGRRTPVTPWAVHLWDTTR